jgi:hypothetical protein
MSASTWKYLFVQIGHARGFKANIWRPYAVNGEPLANWEKGPDWQTYFQKLGDEGWEFVTFDDHFLTDPVIGGKIAIFKRPRHKEPRLKRVAPAEEHRPPFLQD